MGIPCYSLDWIFAQLAFFTANESRAKINEISIKRVRLADILTLSVCNKVIMSEFLLNLLAERGIKIGMCSCACSSITGKSFAELV